MTICVVFSRKNGFIVQGDTKYIAHLLGKKGLGLSFSGAMQFWYLNGSRSKHWNSNFEDYLIKIRDICKDKGLNFNFLNR